MVAHSIDPTRPYLFSNTQYWFEREFLYYPFADFDVNGELRPLKDKLILVNGELTNRQPYQYRANAMLAERLGLEVVHFPGEHVGHATRAQQFSQRLLESLKGKDEHYATLCNSCSQEINTRMLLTATSGITAFRLLAFPE